jgi:hypothetical protein
MPTRALKWLPELRQTTLSVCSAMVKQMDQEARKRLETMMSGAAAEDEV